LLVLMLMLMHADAVVVVVAGGGGGPFTRNSIPTHGALSERGRKHEAGRRQTADQWRVVMGVCDVERGLVFNQIRFETHVQMHTQHPAYQRAHRWLFLDPPAPSRVDGSVVGEVKDDTVPVHRTATDKHTSPTTPAHRQCTVQQGTHLVLQQRLGAVGFVVEGHHMQCSGLHLVQSLEALKRERERERGERERESVCVLFVENRKRGGESEREREWFCGKQ
jgi:hypothetical protein